MRLDSHGGGGARVCMRWDGRGACGVVGVSRNGVGIGRNKGFSDKLQRGHRLDLCYRWDWEKGDLRIIGCQVQPCWVL